jgi:hypothetical protein
MPAWVDDDAPFRMLAVYQGQWGERIAKHVERSCPVTWTVHIWRAPRFLPPVVDDPPEFLPPLLPQVDLVLALGETAGAAQLLPDLVKMTSAKSVIAPIDRTDSLPAGLVAQAWRWLTDLGVAVVFPKPFCSLTEKTVNCPPLVKTYDDPLIRRFARQFGQPQFRLTLDGGGRIAAAEVERDSACGCARAVAQGLVGHLAEEAEYEAGMLHHHFPCLASMDQDADCQDTLMHVSGHIVRQAVQAQVKDHLKPPQYFRPMGRHEAGDSPG